MKITEPIAKGVNQTIRSLTRYWGVDADIYFPVSYNNVQHGYKDNDIQYPTTPNISQKVLIPAIFKKRIDADVVLDLYGIAEENEISMFVEIDQHIPDYSKVVVKSKRFDIQNFLVERCDDIVDDERIIYKKYRLVPINDIDVDRNKDQFVQKINQIESGMLEPNTIDDLAQDHNITDNSDMTYSPIG